MACTTTRQARADEATVSVGPPEYGYTHGRFARPPDPDPPIATYAYSVDARSEGERPSFVERDVYRSPFRLQLGPAAMTTGRGLGMGLGVAADFGRGTVGARLAAAWLRGERQSDDTGIGQYTGELTLDLNKRGQVHPVFGVGFGVARVSRPEGSGNVGIGIARFGLEYSLGLEDTDVRLGGGITGVLPGPADREVSNVKPYALVGANVGIGF